MKFRERIKSILGKVMYAVYFVILAIITALFVNGASGLQLGFYVFLFGYLWVFSVIYFIVSHT